jgi:glycosyltransferase involved in cell wall biosynthesis
VRLLYILGSYYPAQSGGPNNTIHWQAKYLSKNGFNVTVASLKSGLTQDDINNYKIKLNAKNDIEGVKAFYFDFFKSRYLSFRFYFWMLLNFKKFDFIQLTSYYFPITWFAAFLCNLYKIQFSLAPRGELEDNALKYSNLLKRLINKVLLIHLYKKASFILVTSKQELSFSKKYFHHKMKFELIPNYIDLSNNKKLTNDEIESKRNILYLGRIHPKKGIENLIKAYLRLDLKLSNGHFLLIAGSGNPEYRKELENLAYSNEMYRDKIFFLGHKQGAEKEKLYKESKVFVLPSYSENFGNVVLESLSHSTPVISSKYTPWKSLEENKCGFWVENSPNELAAKLKDLLTMEDHKYIKYATNSYNYVCREFDIGKNIEKLNILYKSYSK